MYGADFNSVPDGATRILDISCDLYNFNAGAGTKLNGYNVVNLLVLPSKNLLMKVFRTIVVDLSFFVHLNSCFSWFLYMKNAQKMLWRNMSQ